MTLFEGGLLILAGIVAGVINTLAGAGSLLTVPALVLLHMPGTLANGTNRLGVLVHNLVASWRFHTEGVSGIRIALPLLLPVTLGSLLGAYAISLLPARTFEQLFALLTFVLIIPMVRPLSAPRRADAWPPWLTRLVFFGVGLFGGAFQAGVGLLLIAALAHAGHPLLRANSVKVVINAVLTASALVVFAARGQVAWLPGAVLAAGYGLGALIGVRLAIAGGETLIRVFVAASALALATKMLGWW